MKRISYIFLSVVFFAGVAKCSEFRNAPAGKNWGDVLRNSLLFATPTTEIVQHPVCKSANFVEAG